MDITREPWNKHSAKGVGCSCTQGWAEASSDEEKENVQVVALQRYSLFSLIGNALSGHGRWQPVLLKPELKRSYDIVIIGAGGHGLATAYYLARNHGVSDIAVLERSWLGSGNVARNTVTIRSNYLRPESIPFYVKSVSMYENLSRELNFNLMHSKRTMIDIIQTYPKLREIKRRMYNMHLFGANYEPVDVAEIRRRIPSLTGGGKGSRLPVLAGMIHTDAAVNRHDAVAWAYARAAAARGIEIHQHTPVTRLKVDSNGSIGGVETPKGVIKANTVAVAVSGHTTQLTTTLGLKLPLRSFNLQAFVSEPIQPLIDVVVNCPDIGVYFSQTAKGELVIGGAPDPGQSFRRGINQLVFEQAVSAMLELFPAFQRLKLLRQWGGTVDITPDGSPIISKTKIPGLFVTAGWWGGYKAIPAGGLSFAHLLAEGEPHELARAFTLERFGSLDYLMEAGTTTRV